MRRASILLGYAILVFAGLRHAALAQMGKGSIVIVSFTADKAIFVADSRIVHQRGNTRLAVLDDNCKISVLGDGVVFSAVNNTSFVPDAGDAAAPWNAQDDAKRAYAMAQSVPVVHGDERLTAMANPWLESAKTHFLEMIKFHPAWMEPTQNPRLVEAIFVSVFKGKFTYATPVVDWDGHSLGAGILPLMNNSDTLAMGKSALFAKFQSEKMDAPNLEKQASDPRTRWLIRIAGLIAANEPSGVVGGPIDALEMSKDGSFNWVARKKNCPAN